MPFTSLGWLVVSKLPIRQVTNSSFELITDKFSKLPIRQVTSQGGDTWKTLFSKLPIRQVT